MKHSIVNRLIIGKSIGFVAGLLAFLIMPFMGATLDLKFGLGMVLLYTMVGAFIAFMGIFERHPVLKFKMPWWFTGIYMGLIMHLILILLSYDQLVLMMQQMDIWGMVSPWWVLIDGSILGLIIAFAATKFSGEGKKLPLE